MAYYIDDPEKLTLNAALDGGTGDDLKRLVVVTGDKPPTRKADRAAVIVRHLQGDRLRMVWQGLDELQQAAVAEVVHADTVVERRGRRVARQAYHRPLRPGPLPAGFADDAAGWCPERDLVRTVPEPRSQFPSRAKSWKPTSSLLS